MLDSCIIKVNNMEKVSKYYENKKAVSTYIKERRVVKAFRDYVKDNEIELNVKYDVYDRLLKLKPNVLNIYYDILLEEGQEGLFNKVIN